MANTKKLATTVAAVATAAAVLVGGTFAWQSISQTALNEASDVVNPGGRLHNDMWYVSEMENNNDIYVENFANEDIYARVRLSEYMEIVMNQGTAAEKVETVAGAKYLNDEEVTDKATDNTTGYTYDYATHYFDQTNDTDAYWTWDTDGSDADETYYMPTFNLNKDSLAADLNGLYVDRVGGISNRADTQYEEQKEWDAGDTKEGYEIYDGDSNNADEIGTDPLVLADIIKNGQASQYYAPGAIVLTDTMAIHTANTVGATSGLISMDEWLTMVGYNAEDGSHSYDANTHGDYWVYDTDGWVYWSGAIAGRNDDDTTNTTGLLLDSTTLNGVMDDTWYYAIHAEGEFVTADDLGVYGDTATTFSLTEATETDVAQDYYEGGTGFYENGISENALTLLKIIGVNVSGEDEGDNETEQGYITATYATGTVDDDGNVTMQYNLWDYTAKWNKLTITSYDSSNVEDEDANVTVEISNASVSGDGYKIVEEDDEENLEYNTYVYKDDNKTYSIKLTEDDGNLYVCNVIGDYEEYEIDLFENDLVFTYTVTITDNTDPSISTTFNVTVNVDVEEDVVVADNYAISTADNNESLSPGSSYTMSLTNNGEEVSDVTWSVEIVNTNNSEYDDGTLGDTAFSGSTLSVADDELATSENSDDYNIIKVTASDSDGKALATRNYLINTSGIRVESAYYDSTGNQIAELTTGDYTWKMIQCASSNEYLDDYLSLTDVGYDELTSVYAAIDDENDGLTTDTNYITAIDIFNRSFTVSNLYAGDNLYLCFRSADENSDGYVEIDSDVTMDIPTVTANVDAGTVTTTLSFISGKNLNYDVEWTYVTGYTCTLTFDRAGSASSDDYTLTTDTNVYTVTFDCSGIDGTITYATSDGCTITVDVTTCYDDSGRD